MGFFDNRIFASFNTLFSRTVNNANATIVGPSKTLTGEFPEEVSFERLYEFYNGWPQIKRSTDVEHQKFMGAGINVSSNNKEFNDFIDMWWEKTNADQKWSSFVLSTLITGNGIMEIQYAEGGEIGNIEQIPMQTIFRVFRDQFANDLKMVQVVDGVFKDINPRFYIRWAINNPDRQAFGKSEFFSVAAPRKITAKVDPESQIPTFPSLTTTSILDAEAELQAAEVQIKKIVARPKIFGSFPGMPQSQLDSMEKEMADPNNDKFFWAFNKEAKVAEAAIQNVGKFDKYQEDLNNLISLAGGFPEKIITNPGGFSFASSTTPMDVIDERMAVLHNEASELIKDQLLRPLAESWGFEDFDDYEVVVTFKPTVRKLKFEEIVQIPDTLVPPKEKREMLKDLQISLDDEIYEEFIQQNPVLPPAFTTDSPTSKNPITIPQEQQPEKNPLEQERPAPGIGIPTAEYLFKNPTVFEKYLKDIVEVQVNERLGLVKLASGVPNNSVNNTTSGRDPNTTPPVARPIPGSTHVNRNSPPNDLIVTSPNQAIPPRITDQKVIDAINAKKDWTDPRVTPDNNEPNPQGPIPPHEAGQSLDPNNPSAPPEDSVVYDTTAGNLPGGTKFNLPPNFKGDIPPHGKGSNDDGSRGLTRRPFTKPTASAKNPSNIPQNPNQQEPSKNLKRLKNKRKRTENAKNSK